MTATIPHRLASHQPRGTATIWRSARSGGISVAAVKEAGEGRQHLWPLRHIGLVLAAADWLCNTHFHNELERVAE
jgi:hypothetical protein